MAFSWSGCGSEYVTIPNSVTEIAAQAFEYSGVKNAIIPGSVKVVGTSMFYSGSITNVVLESGVPYISANMFSRTPLENIVIADTVSIIGSSAFSGCSKLKNPILPSTLNTIGNNAFQGCSTITDITVPAGVQIVGGYAFKDCTKLKSIKFLGNAPMVDEITFENVTADCTAYVSKNSTGWDTDIPGEWMGIKIDYFDPPTFTVTFDANGGSGTMDAQMFTEGVEGELAANVFTSGGQEFVGWSTNAVGDVVFTNRQSISVWANMTLYAQWQKQTPSPEDKGFVVVQYLVPQYQLRSISDAETAITNSALWLEAPVTNVYQTLSFSDMDYDKTFNHVPYPCNQDFNTVSFVIEASGRINISEPGDWTFACGSDDGFRVTIKGNGINETFACTWNRTFGRNLTTIHFPVKGVYDVRLVHFEYWGGAEIDFSVAKGSRSSFDSTAFRLVGDPKSGVTIAEDASGENINGLVAYYPFSGDADDASGNGNNGVVCGATLTSDRHGNPDSAYYFSGYDLNSETGAYIEVPNSGSLYNITTSVTVSAWIRIDNGDWASIVCKGYETRQYSIQFKCDSETRWNTTTLQNNIKATSATPTPSEWHHVAMTYDGAKQTAYLDGRIIGFGMASDAISKVAEPLYIGIDPPGGLNCFAGAIDEVYIYNRALSLDEIQELYGEPINDSNEGDDLGALYCVIDLSGGPNAESYPISYLTEAPIDGWTDEYKTDKLVLRRVEPGSFVMGSPSSEAGRYSGEVQHQVTLSKPFYIGVFEVTQKQYELVTGKMPSKLLGDMRPVECVSWNDIRGDSAIYNWPGASNVSPDSFIGLIRAKSGITSSDLPTEAQWEYACRAGTTSAFNNGGNSESDLSKLGRYDNNLNDSAGGYAEHTAVGSYLANNWGLYDMHGNVWEWCLDWYETGYSSASVIDPVGPASSPKAHRETRGGSFANGVRTCRSANRGSVLAAPADKYPNLGFRIACTAIDMPVTTWFNGNGGAVDMLSQSYILFGAYSNLPSVSRDGYVFDGWWTAAKGGERISENTIVGGVAMLYAHWKHKFSMGGNCGWTEISDNVWQSGETTDDATNLISMTVQGPGTVMFDWKVSCEGFFRQYRLDYLAFLVDGVEVGFINGETDWGKSAFVVNGEGQHTLSWSYVKDEIESAGDDCGWFKDVVWLPEVMGMPSVVGDENAELSGDEDGFFVIKPSGKNKDVEISIPNGVDAQKVTLEVSTAIERIRPNGANIRFVSNGSDITHYLNIPATVGGVLDMARVRVKDEIVREAMDVSKGAIIDINSSSPVLTTSETKTGLTYTLLEGTTLPFDDTNRGDSKVGDGSKWTPRITVKGGSSGFYTIKVEK